MSNPRKQLPRRSDEDWYRLIMDCRKSGLSDAQFCRVNGIPNSSFCTAIKRLRKKSFAIPEASDVDIYDLTLKREEEHLQKEQVLQEQIDYLTKKLFGKSSEKRNDDFEGQLNLFNEAETEKTAPDPEEEDFVTVEKHTRKRKSTMADKFADFPVQKVYLDVPEDQRICANCGTPLERIGEEFVRKEIEIVKPSIR